MPRQLDRLLQMHMYPGHHIQPTSDSAFNQASLRLLGPTWSLPTPKNSWGNRQDQKPVLLPTAAVEHSWHRHCSSCAPVKRVRSTTTSCCKSWLGKATFRWAVFQAMQHAPSALNRDLIGTSPAIRMLIMRASARERETQRRRLATDHKFRARACRWRSQLGDVRVYKHVCVSL